MHFSKTQYRHYTVFFLLLFILSCNNNDDNEKNENIITTPVSMDTRVAESISRMLRKAIDNSGKIDDSIKIEFAETAKSFYSDIDYKPVWCSAEKWIPVADSLYRFIALSENEGMFPDDYHFKELKVIKDSLDSDSLTRMNAIFWTKAELMLTDGFMHIIKDLKLGRLQPDSVSLNKDSILAADFFVTTLTDLLVKNNINELFISLQPKNKNYWELKKGIKNFVDSMDRQEYTYVAYPFKKGDETDSLHFISTLQKRLQEGNCMDPGISFVDSATLFRAIKKYQLQNGLTADGKYGKILIGSLNNSDAEKFKRIAVTLDKYKQLPEEMPGKYIWVNLPGYYLWLVDADTVVFESKVICGKPETRTPLLNSEISDMITYPTWTVPNSIIVKQYLPKLKNDPNYISTIGLKLLNNKGEVIDPNTVTWSKYSRGIPYKVMQGSGDNNSLGVIKFNFSNPYFVYLHDTNQRYLFKNATRALSHGCVRVQQWQKLAYYIADNDSLLSAQKGTLKYTADSIKNWIARKEPHRVDVKNHIPLFIRYFSCEGKNGAIKFYDDIYGEDKLLIEKYLTR